MRTAAIPGCLVELGLEGIAPAGLKLHPSEDPMIFDAVLGHGTVVCWLVDGTAVLIGRSRSTDGARD